MSSQNGCGPGRFSGVPIAPEVPAALMAQLRDPGKLVIPVGTRRDQSLMVVTKKDGATESRVVTQCRFVPLRGNEGWR